MWTWRTYTFGKKSKDGHLTFKEAYSTIIKPNSTSPWNPFPSDADTLPALSMIIWRFMNNKLPTNDNLSLRGFKFPSICNLCHSNCENSAHLFFHCKFSILVWYWFVNSLQLNVKIDSITDCWNLLTHGWSPQAKSVHASIVGIFYHKDN